MNVQICDSTSPVKSGFSSQGAESRDNVDGFAGQVLISTYFSPLFPQWSPSQQKVLKQKRVPLYSPLYETKKLILS